ncbi:Endonuclease III [Dirofilaria immitis]|nr:Endonuclease III [Dirofilaria immitis]
MDAIASRYQYADKIAEYPIFKGIESSALWMKHLENIKQMRNNRNAPVNSMDCHMLADALAEPKVFRFQILLSLVLSSQTKDHITATAVHNIFLCERMSSPCREFAFTRPRLNEH